MFIAVWVNIFHGELTPIILRTDIFVTWIKLYNSILLSGGYAKLYRKSVCDRRGKWKSSVYVIPERLTNNALCDQLMTVRES
jgi:hypothetical protein